MDKNCRKPPCDAGCLQDIPLLRYLKNPASNLDKLYIRYPDGGEYGWFCLIPEKKAFAFWDKENKKWDYIAGGAGGGTTDYLDLSNKPVLKTSSSKGFTPADEELKGVINLHRIAKTGGYVDLTGKPVLNTTHLTALDPEENELIEEIINLHRVAKTGNFNDLVDAPDISGLLERLSKHIESLAGDFPGHVQTGGDLTFTEGVGRIKDSAVSEAKLADEVVDKLNRSYAYGEHYNKRGCENRTYFDHQQ